MPKKRKSKKEKDFSMPEWINCSWRRKSCGKDSCPICGKIKANRQKHIDQGEDPDDLKYALEEVGDTLKETLALIKQDAAKHGFEIENIDDIQLPPEPEEFPFHGEVMQWRDSLYSLTKNQETASWMLTEDAEDLFWYANTICAKTYRQLTNRWHMEKGDDYGDFDFDYTQYVLKECFGIVEKAMANLVKISSRDKVQLMLLSDEALKLKEKALKI